MCDLGYDAKDQVLGRFFCRGGAGLVGVDVVHGDDGDAGVDAFGCAAGVQGGQALDDIDAHLLGPLDHGGVDVAIADALEGVLKVVKGDHHQVVAVGKSRVGQDLGHGHGTGHADGNDAIQVLVSAQHGLADVHAFGKVVVGGDGIHHLDVGIFVGKDLVDAFHAFVEVGHDQRTGEDGDLALAAQRLGHHLSLLASGGDVVGAIVGHALRVGRIRVKGHDIDACRLRLGNDGFDRCGVQGGQADAVDTFVDQVFQDLDLLGGVAGGRCDPLVLDAVHVGACFLQAGQDVIVEGVCDLGYDAKDQILLGFWGGFVCGFFFFGSSFLGWCCFLCGCRFFRCLGPAGGQRQP